MFVDDIIFLSTCYWNIYKNYSVLDSKKTVKTEICLYPAEFESYNIATPSSVTFCLKELKAVLFFAEFTGLPVQFYVSTAGKWVDWTVSKNEANLNLENVSK